MMTHPPQLWHILGAGAIGSLWACHLSLTGHQVRLILRNPLALQNFSGSIQLKTPAFEREIPMVAELAKKLATDLTTKLTDSDTPIQRLLVTTKSYATESAIASVRHRLNSSSVILLLQNGLGQQQQLADQLPEIAVYAGTTTEGAYRTSTQQLVHAGSGESWIGPINAAAFSQGSAVLDSLLQLPLTTAYDPKIQDRLWQKLAINAVINGLTAIHNCQNGQLALNPDYRQQVQQLCTEVELLAAALRQPLFERPLLEIALEIASATANNYSSMQQDVHHQRHTEIDFINGYICCQANRLGINTPYNQALVSTITGMHPLATEN